MLKLPIQRGYTSSKDVFGYIRSHLVDQNNAAALVNIKLPCSVEDKLCLLVLLLRLQDHDILDAGRVT